MCTKTKLLWNTKIIWRFKPDAFCIHFVSRSWYCAYQSVLFIFDYEKGLVLLPRVFKPFQTSKYWYCLSQNRLFCNGLWSMLNACDGLWSIYCLEDVYPKSKICRIGPTAAVPVGKRLPLSRMVVQLHRVPPCPCAALQLGFGKVICLHHGDDIYFCWKWLICYFQAGMRRKGGRMGFCRVIFPTWGSIEGLLKEKKPMICVHATSLLLSVPQSAFNMLGEWKKELMRLPSPSVAFLHISAIELPIIPA